jgi:hypothetical protein
MEHNAMGQERNFRFESGDHQFVILTQLLQEVVRMRHVDEVFLWLMDKMVQHLRLEVGQIWTMGAASPGPVSAVLRATSFYDQSVHPHVVMNSHITNVVSTILNERQNVPLQPVENLFSHYQSNLLWRYGLNYSACGLTLSDLAIPSGDGFISQQDILSTVAVVVFLTQPRQPNLLIIINRIMQQALLIAKKQGLLQDSTAREIKTPDWNVQLRFLSSVYELVPVRTGPGDSMRSSNPFTSSVPTSDKRTLAFFSAVDGSRSVAEIATLKKMDSEDVIAALRLLLQQERIQVYTKRGQPVASEMLLQMM